MSDFEDTPSMRALNYPPHITLAMYDAAEVTEQRAIAAMQRMVQDRPAIELSFDRIRSFAGPPLVLWLDPEPKAMLLEMHHRVSTEIDPSLCRPHYRPGSWIPHCTLAMSTLPDRNREALAFASNFRGGARVVFDRVDCVTYPPVTVVAMVKLMAQRSENKGITR
jgi:2'-5' RNA ligase